MEFTPRKIIFFVIIGLLIIGLATGLSYLNTPLDNTKLTAPKVLSLWVLGEDTEGYKKLESGFQKIHGYEKTTLQITKFTSWREYERALLASFPTDKGPDIFFLPNSGAPLLEENIQGIPATIFEGDSFQTRFFPWFDTLIVEEKGDDNRLKVAGYKGVPLGYETPIVFYNAELTGEYPKTWKDISQKAIDFSQTDRSFIGIGLGAPVVSDAPDILAAMYSQAGFIGFLTPSAHTPNTITATYQSFLGETPSQNTSEGSENQPIASNAGNNLAQLLPSLESEKLTVFDAFIQGKIASLIGFPSMVIELEDALKRAKDQKQIDQKQILTAFFPQEQDNGKITSGVRYMYAAMAKKTLHPQAAQDLLKYFATPEAGDIYIQSNPYKLPAQRALINTRNNASLSPVFPRISYEHCMDNNMKLIPFELISRDDYLEQMNQLLNNRAPATTITQTISATQACLKNQLVDKTQLAVNCRSIQ